MTIVGGAECYVGIRFFLYYWRAIEAIFGKDGLLSSVCSLVQKISNARLMENPS